MTDEECIQCKTQSPIFDLNRICCGTRLVMNAPNREQRLALLERWRKRGMALLASRIEAQVRAK